MKFFSPRFKYLLLNLKIFFLFLIFPVFVHSQSNQFFTIQTEVDAANAVFGGTVNDRAYNGTFKIGYSRNWFRGDVFYETFPWLQYESGGINLFYLFNDEKPLKFGPGIQMSVIDRPNRFKPSLGLNGLLEYHLDEWFFTARIEIKMRTEWGYKIVRSGFLGVGYKIFEGS